MYKKRAILSKNRLYRYILWREWDSSKDTCVFIGLNPSTADENEDDPTLRRCVTFAKDWGYAKCVIVNLLAYRTTKSEELKNDYFFVFFKSKANIKPVINMKIL